MKTDAGKVAQELARIVRAGHCIADTATVDCDPAVSRSDATRLILSSAAGSEVTHGDPMARRASVDSTPDLTGKPKPDDIPSRDDPKERR